MNTTSSGSETRGSRRGWLRSLVGVSAILGLLSFLFVVAGAPAGAQPPVGDAPLPTIGDAMQGRVSNVSATAKGGFNNSDSLTVWVSVTNKSEVPMTLAIPRGSMFATDNPSEQTAVVSGPSDELAAQAALAPQPTIDFAPGTSEHALRGFCAQETDSGPNDITPMKFVAIAAEPLPTVLANVVRTGADNETAQEAVWWVTDNPSLPLDSEATKALLTGFDTKAFADAPEQVVPDASYTPTWAGGRTETGGPITYNPSDRKGVNLAPLLAAVMGLVLLVGFVMLVRSSRRAVAPDTVGQHRWTGTNSPGWYPDPANRSSLRWWDGNQWTGR